MNLSTKLGMSVYIAAMIVIVFGDKIGAYCKKRVSRRGTAGSDEFMVHSAAQRERSLRTMCEHMERGKLSADEDELEFVGEVQEDNTGRVCAECGEGTYKEMCLNDGFDGALHCTHCNAEVKRWGNNEAKPSACTV